MSHHQHLSIAVMGVALGMMLERPVAASELTIVKLVIHVHSTISAGSLDPNHIIDVAALADVDGVIFTDSAIRRWEYGVWPARNLIKRTVEQPSVATLGPERYLSRIHGLMARSPELLAIAGLEVTPFYYWHRSPFDQRGGQIRAGNTHMLIFGLNDPQVIRQLPWHAFDPYHGNQGAKPYQQMIEFVRAHGGIIFWAHPMAAARAERVGNMEAWVEPYPHLLEVTTDYQGFALANPAALTLVEPGALWDRLLMAYGQGTRAHPVWILGELDWRRPQERALDQVVTNVMVLTRDEPAVLRALAQGRMWVVFRATDAQAPTLTQCALSTEDGAQRAILGETLTTTQAVRLSVVGDRQTHTSEPLRLVVIKDGQILHTEEVTQTHFEYEWQDAPPTHPTYYRVWMSDASGSLYTNPIFLKPGTAE